jgi:hypothetical protein
MRFPRLKLSDRITWSVMLWIFFNLLWLKFLEAFVPLWVGTIVFTLAAAAFIVFGPGPDGGPGEEEDVAPQGTEGGKGRG